MPVYQINKGINKPIEFKGLKAQYIGYLAGGLVGLLILFAVMYISGLPVYCLYPDHFGFRRRAFLPGLQVKP